MKVVMFTNTYLPHVGGVARSVERFRNRLMREGVQVLVVAPKFSENTEKEDKSGEVIRINAIQNFNGSDFSVAMPLSVGLQKQVSDFQPDLIHSHHPFLLGNTARRVAGIMRIPLVFTHHTMYEHYLHYVPAMAKNMKSAVIQLTTTYANQANHVIVPSASIGDILKSRGVETGMTEIPTGVELDKYDGKGGAEFKRKHDIPDEAFVVGHLGRLAKEKNLVFLAKSLSGFLKKNKKAYALIVGSGDDEDEVKKILSSGNCLERCRFPGVLKGGELSASYAAMDCFAFASKSETQGMVIAEAMASGVPVVALDAPGAREVLRHRINGFLIQREDEEDFVDALSEFEKKDEEERGEFSEEAQKTAEEFSVENCTSKMKKLYEDALGQTPMNQDESVFDSAIRMVQREWEYWSAGVGGVMSEKPKAEKK